MVSRSNESSSPEQELERESGDEIGFLEFFQKPPGGSRVTARQHKHQTQFLGISDEPPGGRG
ncbi:hypothetical protein DEO72_LG2g2908 [Vigna unguiculata]|uniref:Uncharacterized protein n=1 Tax=Vigna unguiculata TaxID=3917 RepID=A0A4D6L261_VIGUN|nr:hypothetical protein DEO72_LG2g2908 [Vigna unguiculata]